MSESGGTSDADLLAAHVAGDADAFGELFARHRDRLWAVAVRTTGDREDAADALQDAMIAAFRRADTFRGDAAVTTWLHRIVVNACLDRLRRRRVRATEPWPQQSSPSGTSGDRRPGENEDVVGPESERAVVDPADLAVDHERRAAVLDALATLPLDQRAALVLVDMEGYSVEETAQILMCAPGTVKSRCSRGRAKLHPLLLAHQEGNRSAVSHVPPPSPAAGRARHDDGTGGAAP